MSIHDHHAPLLFSSFVVAEIGGHRKVKQRSRRRSRKGRRGRKKGNHRYK